MEDLTSIVYCASDEDACAATNSGIKEVYEQGIQSKGLTHSRLKGLLGGLWKEQRL
jgi:hypothetical protein